MPFPGRPSGTRCRACAGTGPPYRGHRRPARRRVPGWRPPVRRGRRRRRSGRRPGPTGHGQEGGVRRLERQRHRQDRGGVDVVAAAGPEHAKRPHEVEGVVGPGGEGPVESSSDVRLLGVEGVQVSRTGPRHAGQVLPDEGLHPLRGGGLPGGGRLRRPPRAGRKSVLADGLEQAIAGCRPRVLDHDERLVDEAGEDVEDGRRSSPSPAATASAASSPTPPAKTDSRRSRPAPSSRPGARSSSRPRPGASAGGAAVRVPPVSRRKRSSSPARSARAASTGSARRPARWPAGCRRAGGRSAATAGAFSVVDARSSGGPGGRGR